MSANAAALERVLLRPQESSSFPLDLAAVFPRRAPLAIEVGFGGGEALAWWATQRPEWNFIAFERAPESVQRAAASLLRAGVGERVRLVLGDARHLLRELIPAGAAARVLMQFPMPWPKSRHAKHRLTDPDFVAALAAVLEPAGRFELVTDQEWFAREAETALRARSTFAVSALESNPPRVFRTRYERRWLSEGRSIWRLTATQSIPQPCPLLSRHPAMDHLSLLTQPSTASVLALSGRRFHENASVGVVQEVASVADGWLLQVLSADGDFSQRFMIRLQIRPEGVARLSLEQWSRPFPTPAVSALLLALRQVLDDTQMRNTPTKTR